MDRSLIQTERSRSAFAGRIGTTMKKPTTPPRNGTVVTVLHWRNTRMDAGGHGTRAISDSRVPGFGLASQFARRAGPIAVPMQTGLHAANDAGRRRDSEPAVSAAVRQQRAHNPRPKELMT
jgi:hypothetical protein